MSDAGTCSLSNLSSAGGVNGHQHNGKVSDLVESGSPANGKSPSYPKTRDSTQQLIDREERLRLIREKQNEERQKKLEELKQQALAAQKFRERTEEERRRRIEELRNRENDRRHQVEERKRLILEAEKGRKVAIVRRNQEREARIESKRKMERSSVVFAFGSSIPRMMEPTDSGSTYWTSRRATSTMDVMCMSAASPGPLTRRSSERELANGNKKRATSAGGLLDRKNADGDHRATDSIYEVLYPTSTCSFSTVDTSRIIPTFNSSIIFGEGNDVSNNGATMTMMPSAARRKTDLMPTVPSTSRDMTTQSRTSSACLSRRSPGRAFSMTRLDQLSQPRRVKPSGCSSTSPNNGEQRLGHAYADMSKSMTHLAGSAAPERNLRRSPSTSKSMMHLGPPRMTRAERLRKLAREAIALNTTPAAATSAKPQTTSPSGFLAGSRSGDTTPRPPSAFSQHSGSNNVASSSRPRPATAPARKPRPTSIAITGVTLNADFKQSGSGGKSPLTENRPPVPKVHVTKKATSKVDAGRKTERKLSKSSVNATPKETPIQSPTIELSTEGSFSGSESGTTKSETAAASFDKLTQSMYEMKTEDLNNSSESARELAECDMSASMTSSQIRRITTEEQAKAALAERRRLAREQAEREAELEQQRLEAERLAEEERLRKEEEEQRRMEEEQLRLLEEAKKSEEARLLQAIEETKKREEEERQRKEEELRLKVEKEEADRKAKEEAERQRQEMELKLKKEEEERIARRKRVEAIMLRTRAKGGTPLLTPTKENNGDIIEDKLNGIYNKVISDNSNGSSENNKFLAEERNISNNHSDNVNPKQNGVHCAVESRKVTNNLLDLSGFDVINTNMISDAAVSPQILDLPVGKDTYNANKTDITDLLS